MRDRLGHSRNERHLRCIPGHLHADPLGSGRMCRRPYHEQRIEDGSDPSVVMLQFLVGTGGLASFRTDLREPGASSERTRLNLWEIHWRQPAGRWLLLVCFPVPARRLEDGRGWSHRPAGRHRSAYPYPAGSPNTHGNAMCQTRGNAGRSLPCLRRAGQKAPADPGRGGSPRAWRPA